MGPDFFGTFGPLESLTLLERRTDGNQSGSYRYRATFQKKKVWVFALTPDGKIAGLQPTDE